MGPFAPVISGNHSYSIDVLAASTTSSNPTAPSSDIPPIASFTASPSPAPAETMILFDGTGSRDPDGTIVSWVWDFGDRGTRDDWTGVGPTVSRFYYAPGSYNVNLTVTDNSGSTNTIITKFTVTDVPPTAKFTFSPAIPNSQAPTNFDASESSDLDGFIAKYAWDFGDGTTVSVASSNTSHEFPIAGSYLVGLMVTDNGGWTASYSRRVTVGPTNMQVSCGRNDTCWVRSNSTLINAASDPNKLQFNVAGPSGTVGWANVTLPWSAVPNIDRLRISLDGARVPTTSIVVTRNATYYFAYFTYDLHSPRNVEIDYNPAPDTLFGLDPTIFYTGLVGLAATVAAFLGGFVVGRRRAKVRGQA